MTASPTPPECPSRAPAAAELHPLVVEAMKKAATVWIAPADAPATATWLLWADGAAWVVHGGAEQAIPGLAEATTCAVTVRGDTGGHIVTWPATVHPVPPGSPEWDERVPQLVQKRLNLRDPADAPERWARESVVSRLVPAGDPIAAGTTLPTDSGAAPPRPTSATTPTPVPTTLGRRRRPARRR